LRCAPPTLRPGLAGWKTATEEPEEIPQRFRKDASLDETKAVVEAVRRNLRDYWKCLR
jgi:hypothetical protein